jgi:predicted dehydrogenase
MTMGTTAVNPRWTAAVVGLGRVGMGYDYTCTDGSKVLTHAQAFRQHPRFVLTGGVDPDPQRRAQFTKKFAIPAFSSPDELFAVVRPDVVALAIPTTLHFAGFRTIEQYPWRLLLCEKPIARNLNEARDMVERTAASGRKMAVNYMRRTEPGANTVRSMIRDGILGEVYKGTVWYSKGMLNNGSHFIDLLTHWLGEACDVRVLSDGRVWDGVDPEPDVHIMFGATEVYFLAGREERFNLAEVELLGTEGKILYGRSGRNILHWKRCPDPANPGFTPLVGTPDVVPNDADRFQFHVLDDVARVLDGESLEAASNGQTALKTLETVLSAFTQRRG